MFNKIKNIKIFGYLKRVWEELENQKMNRQLIGEDRDGNKYYQYYSYYGLPHRREIRFKQKGKFDLTDLVYYRWLYKFQLQAPTEAEKEQFYLQEKLRYQRALEWDQKQQKIMIQFRKKRQQLLKRDEKMMEIENQLKSKTEIDIKSKRVQ